jgi:hypothetical protein
LKFTRLPARTGSLARIHNRREHIARFKAAVDDKLLACDQRIEKFVTGPVSGGTCCIGRQHGSNAAIK